ncbi:class I SAM-dependent methyltransferase [Pelagibacterales bacterium SAG-MED02]|nr:class I SAM-dependent methyltransferase [Pelagibacterales bacterium SAG-MED02]
MKKIIKQLIPPFLLFLIKKLYFFILIKKNSFKIEKNFQDIEIYDEVEAADRIDEWGQHDVWNEIKFIMHDKKGKILDLACGTGKNILDLKKINKEAQFFGCDISQSLINIAVKNGVNKDYLTCIDATKMNFQENFFDYSYSIGSLEHFTEDGIEKVIDGLYFCTKIASFHMMPVSKKNINEGWMKTYQTFHNNSEEWWVKKFEKKFNKVLVIESSWNDFLSNGKWFFCLK